MNSGWGCEEERVCLHLTVADERVTLARLRAADRDTLLLVDWAELTYDQAALALGVPVGTVRSRLSRARRKIREALDDINSNAPEEHRHD